MVCLDIAASAHTVERTPELIRDGRGNGFYKLSLMLEGESMVMQDSREAVLREGDLALYDSSRPYSLLVPEGARTAIIMFPKELLALPADAIAELTAVRFDGSSGLAAGISLFMTRLMDQLDHFSRPSGSRLPQNIVDLVGTMLSAELDQQPQGSSSSVLMRSIMNYAEQHLGDPDLGPGKIAAQHFISPRYLQMLFQRNGLTVTSWVRERRLERCRRDLEDPALAGETVATLAAKWGFFEATNFSRAFKRQFGLSPRAVRSLDPAAMTTR